MIWEVLRIVVAAAALWLAALVAVMAVKRGRGDEVVVSNTHWLTNISYAVLLTTAALRRFENLDGEPDVWLWLALLAVVLGWVGVLHRVRLARLKGAPRGQG